MEKEFIPYEQALALKELGFNEPCVAFYYGQLNRLEIGFNWLNEGCKNSLLEEIISAPLYQQAFRWFRKKNNCVCEIIRKEVGNHSEFIGWVYIDDRKIGVVSYWDSKSYEEAELACLNKLIEIVKNG